jgi:FlaA1/EpsC-like NDP-sugar epimerase
LKLTGKVFITGGAGTLGKAILRRAKQEGWDAQFTIYSTDPMKHKAIKELYPDVTCVLGSVTDPDSLTLAIAGHDVVIHAAALKHIVECEKYPLATLDVNVHGSQNVFAVCAELQIPHVVAISTDKACAPINTYGVTKMMMERIFHAYAWAYPHTEFHICRYGNVVGSTGSFIHNWRRDLLELGLVNSTVETMTRFWMSNGCFQKGQRSCITVRVLARRNMRLC